MREVQQRLKRAGVDEDTIDQVVDQLKAAGMLDDTAFAAAWVDSRLRANPRSKRMLAWELRQKGADPGAIEASLAGMDETAAALAAARKRLPRLAALPAPERRRKLIEYLARNGFAFTIIEDVLGKLDLAADDAVE